MPLISRHFRLRRGLAAVTTFVLAAATAAPLAAAADGDQEPVIDLRLASLEELMNIEITSVSRKQERAVNVPAAVDVLTSDDIRRSGLTTLPELLRLIPGVQVAQISAHAWAISIRGFNDLYTNKLLVLIDGRSVYTRMFSGVKWETEDLLAEDIDRIEVIRGPNAAVWGANAVNGVVNIITKPATATRGVFATANAGSSDERQLSGRYGGRVGNTSYRIFSQLSDYGTLQTLNGSSAGDSWRRGTTGFRTDWASGADQVMVDGDMTRGHMLTPRLLLTSPVPVTTPVVAREELAVGHALGRWTHTSQDHSTFEVQSYFDMRRGDSPIWNYTRNAFDLDAQYQTRLGVRHELLAGAGYRIEDEYLDGTFAYSIVGTQRPLKLFNVFGQDQVSFAQDRLRLTVGARVEHDTFSEWGVQPNVRAVWTMTPSQHLWGSVSRALRTPSIHDRQLRSVMAAFYDPVSTLPTMVELRGNPDFGTERVNSTEAGYRVNAGTRAAVSVNAFSTRYHDVWTFEPETYELSATPAPFHVVLPYQITNTYGATTRGIEVSGHIVPVSGWQLDGGYTAFFFTSQPLATTRNTLAADYDGYAPQHQAIIRTAVKPWPRVEFDATLARVGQLEQLQVPAYTRLDGRVEIALNRRLSLSVLGQNLVGDQHMEFVEFGDYEPSAYARRTASVQLTWRH